MNDYKELIAELEELLSLNDENLQSLIIENNDLQNTLVDVIDVIEQLVKERDKAVDDLKGLHDKYGICDYCKNAIPETNKCKSYAEYKKCRWEWRGVREVEHETD